MKLSTRGRYGLRAMLDLAVFSNGEHVSLCSIAERQNISDNYLEQVFSILRKAGLIRSVKGAQGGYILGDEPQNIKVGTILRVLEGSLSIIDENEADGTGENFFQKCIKKNVWDKLNACINQTVDSITLADLVEEYKNQNETPMYYI
ncbi:MAG TPA: Rrf2 family transcriptional regulator [Bacillota bacterium]|jgi:Rrf2 family cysteine metabolism transcriptional repressor|nr:Rrf2 family transcriptional regulator [Bacillota bacterium]HOL09526.1 Rrf2 family transcriptional regulator [Bacillota bacterium]HPO98688.1 Rrf2 family transcriptional regulator [Bacillota bacterium]